MDGGAGLGWRAMATWAEFQAGRPTLAAKGEERFDRSGLILLGTIRADGRPRISPVEPVITDGELYLGMMWQSRKAVDLLRDPRCLVHNTVTDRDGKEGEFKAYGRARVVDDADDRERYCQALFAKIDWRPEGEEWHLFAIDIDEVVYQQFGDDVGHLTERWTSAKDD
jgi:nitroimidazol reductase NimA-like FMN-containing flavoprotein (pyridoxamine 5'-phosphate oxidase superfamily)